MRNSLPFEMKEAVVQVCGKTFWLKDPFRSFLLSACLPSELYAQFADESKYKIIRHVLAELEPLGEEAAMQPKRGVMDSKMCLPSFSPPMRLFTDRHTELQPNRLMVTLNSRASTI